MSGQLSVWASLSAVLAIGCAQGEAAEGVVAEAPPQTGDISALSDDFDDVSTIGNWQRIHKVEGWNADQLEKFDIGQTKSGWMTMVPYSSTWYQDYRGILAFKPVSGDFVMTTKLRTTGRNGSGAPRAQFSLAGIMIRAPRNVTPQTWKTGGENYIFLSHGNADQPGQHQFEVKTTQNSDSQLRTSPAGSEEAIIQVARIGSTFILLKNDGGQWTVHQRYDRADFPATVQAGLTVYTDWPNASKLSPIQQNGTVIKNGAPDLLAQFDYVHYRRPQVPAGKSVAQMTDQELLGFLGDKAN